MADHRRSVRTCIGCRTAAVASGLLRVVAVDRDGSFELTPDPRRRLPGRGAWLHPDQRCLQLALRRRAFSRALRVRDALDTAALGEFIAGIPASND